MLHERRETIPSIIKDHPEWHRGRRDYSLWLINASTGEICEKVGAAKEHLSAYLLKPYQRQPHITVFVCGFLTDTPLFEDDYSPEQFRVQAQMLEEGKIKPFFLEIGGLSSFSSAPFLEVRDLEGGIERARAALSISVSEIGGGTFTPHITIGLYSGAYSSKIVAGRISTFKSRPVRLRVERITFATYRAREIAGALTHQFDVALGPK